MNSKNLGMVIVACHQFHMGGDLPAIMEAAGDMVRLVHVADTMDHHRSHGLRYITNPPGNAVRVHQHLKIGDGDVNWDEFFGGLGKLGFYDRDNTVMVSSVFAENEKRARGFPVPARDDERLRRQVHLPELLSHQTTRKYHDQH